jgi:hypothetical protein
MYAIAPYCVIFGAWGLFVARDVHEFIIQFFGNIRESGASNATRTHPLSNPFGALLLEIRSRYLEAYGFIAPGGAINRLKMFILIGYCSGAAIFRLTEPSKSPRRRLWQNAVLTFLFLTFVAGNKMTAYLIYMIIWLAPMLVLAVERVTSRSKQLARVALTVATVLFMIQLGGLGYLIHQNKYGTSYLPAIECALQTTNASDLVAGSSEMAFSLYKLRNFKDDRALGFYSGVTPQVIITNSFWDRLLEETKFGTGPSSKHVRQILDRSTLVFRNDDFKVYRVAD